MISDLEQGVRYEGAAMARNKIDRFRATFVDAADDQQFFAFSGDRIKRDAILAIVIICFPILAFARTDYVLFGNSNTTLLLGLLRFSVLAYSVFAIFYLKQVQTYPAFNRLIGFWLFFLAVSSAVINATRPADYIMFVPVDLTLISLNFMLIRMYWIYLVPLLLFYTLNSIAMLMFFKEGVSSSAALAIFISYFLILFTGSLGSRSLHINRRSVFSSLSHEKELRTRLEEALENIQHLEGLLPICSSCKQIRDEEGDWHRIESYISKRTDAQFTHSLCPQCHEEVLKDLPST
jgi:hypothetical protein